MRNMRKRFFIQDGKRYDAFNLPKGFVVKGDLDLSAMDLESLPDLSSITVNGFFYCSNNKLTSLKGCPQYVGGFDCSCNEIKSLMYGPVKAAYYCCSLNDLQTLNGAPRTTEFFYCAGNNLTNLQYGPVKSLVYDCSNNNITNLDYIPKDCSDFVFFNNPVYKGYKKSLFIKDGKIMAKYSKLDNFLSRITGRLLGKQK